MFAGVYPPVPTPFEDGKVSLSKLAANLDRWLATKLAGFVVAGSNGEAAYLSFEERLALIREARRRAGDRRVIAGTGLETTAGTIELTRASADAGADAVLVLPPHFFTAAMTPDVLRRHYEAVADASPVPVFLYNVPRNTGVNLSADLVVELSQHPNIAGLKDSGGDIVQISDVIGRARPGFAVFAGSASLLFPAVAMGAQGGVTALGNVMPEECCALWDLSREGRCDLARRVQQALIAPNAAVTTRFGVPGLKAAMDALGYFGGDPRPPLLPLAPGDRRAVAEVVLAAKEKVRQVLRPE